MPVRIVRDCLPVSVSVLTLLLIQDYWIENLFFLGLLELVWWILLPFSKVLVPPVSFVSLRIGPTRFEEAHRKSEGHHPISLRQRCLSIWKSLHKVGGAPSYADCSTRCSNCCSIYWSPSNASIINYRLPFNSQEWPCHLHAQINYFIIKQSLLYSYLLSSFAFTIFSNHSDWQILSSFQSLLFLSSTF